MSSEENQQLFEELAGRFDRQQEPRHRDIYLVLAADAALTGGRGGEAERLRARLLQSNPHHLLKPFPTMREAMESADIRDYVADLRRRHPASHAEEVLEKLRAKEPRAAPVFGPVRQPEIPVFRIREEPPPAKSEPIMPLPARPKKRPPTRSPYETAPTASPASAGESVSEGAGRWLATLLFLLGLIFALGLAAFVLLRPFLF
jgi:hypothetical protein